MEFISKYYTDLLKVCDHINHQELEVKISKLLELKLNNGRLFIVGVGGSAGNASHAVNDFRKLANIEAYSVTDNVSELTARINDEGWESSFAEWLKSSRLSSNDAILVLSVGGGDLDRKVSVNICKAIDFAKIKNSKIFSIVGRNGGYAALNSDVCVIVPTVNEEFITPFAESFQAIIWHLFVSHPKLKSKSTKW
jgi:D-sedoheptulose 7-phosphate isomerase